MKKQSEARLLVLEGTPRERGRVHGEALDKLIWEGVERGRYRIRMIHQMDPDTLIDRFMESTGFVDAVKSRTPHLLEEVRGIGEGSGVDFGTIFTYQCVDEQWWWWPGKEKMDASVRCSVLGCFGEGETPALLGQNMDIPNYKGLEVLLNIRHKDSDLESFVYTAAGFIATCGLNNAPLGICCNTVIDLNSTTEGLPVAFIVRAVLEQPTLEKAMDFIQGTRHASGQCYTIGSPDKVVSLECSANKISQYVPYKGLDRVWHTNHPLVNDDMRVPHFKSMGVGTTHPRLDYLKHRLNNPNKSITVDTVKGILSSHEGPVCVHSNYQPAGGCTFGSVIYTLSDQPVLHLATGPPCSNKYLTFRFS